MEPIEYTFEHIKLAITIKIFSFSEKEAWAMFSETVKDINLYLGPGQSFF